MEGLINDPDNRDIPAKRMAVELAHTGKLEEVRAALSRIRVGYFRSEGYRSAYRIVAYSHGAAPAMREVRESKLAYERANGYIGVALGLLDRIGKRDPADAHLP